MSNRNLQKREQSDQKTELRRPANVLVNNSFYHSSVNLLLKLVRDLGRENIVQKSSSLFENLQNVLCYAVLLAIFFMMSLYKSFEHVYRQVFLSTLTLIYYPNKSPQIIRDDVNKFGKIPRRIACIIDLKDDGQESGGIDGMINNISELTAWSISAGIPELSIYEYHGAITAHIPELIRFINKNLVNYFGTDASLMFSIHAPHENLTYHSNNPTNDVNIAKPSSIDLKISLLSRADGKPTIVELTKTMCELAVSKELAPQDITIDLINEELTNLVGMEPDLLVYFGPALDLQDFPPWHVRLSEIYWEPGNEDVNYAVFIRALKKYSQCKVNVGA